MTVSGLRVKRSRQQWMQNASAIDLDDRANELLIVWLIVVCPVWMALYAVL